MSKLLDLMIPFQVEADIQPVVIWDPEFIPIAVKDKVGIVEIKVTYGISDWPTCLVYEVC